MYSLLCVFVSENPHWNNDHANQTSEHDDYLNNVIKRLIVHCISLVVGLSTIHNSLDTDHFCHVNTSTKLPATLRFSVRDMRCWK